jgi:hypothetical protein
MLAITLAYTVKTGAALRKGLAYKVSNNLSRLKEQQSINIDVQKILQLKSGIEYKVEKATHQSESPRVKLKLLSNRCFENSSTVFKSNSLMLTNLQ